MSVPTSYTEASFEDYLKYDVLSELGFGLGWATDMPHPPVTWNIVLRSAEDNSMAIQVEDLKYDVPIGTTLEFIHRTTLAALPIVTTTANHYAGDNTMFISAEVGVVAPSVNYRAETTTAELPIEVDVFPAIIRDTLLALENTDITTISGLENIHKLRTRGRIELWRKVMAQTAFDFPVRTQMSVLNRQQVHTAAQTQYQMAMQDWSNNFEFPEVAVETSKQGAIKVVW